MIDIPTMININVDDLSNWLENSPYENDHIAAKLIETLVAATETKHQDFRELELKLSDYVEVEETNRGLVKRGDFWEARAEALQARVSELEVIRDQDARVIADVVRAIVTTRFMDPPDGGDVSLGKQVRRMWQVLQAAEAKVSKLEQQLENRGLALEAAEEEVAEQQRTILSFADIKTALKKD